MRSSKKKKRKGVKNSKRLERGDEARGQAKRSRRRDKDERKTKAINLKGLQKVRA